MVLSSRQKTKREIGCGWNLNDHSSRWVNIKVVDPAVFERMQEIASEVLNEYALYDDSLNWDTLQSVKQDQTGVFAIYLDWNE